MHSHKNDKKKNNTLVTATALFTLAFFAVASTGVNTVAQSAFEVIPDERKAPVIVSGGNIYLVW